MTFPVIAVEIAFATTPFVTPTWTDVTSFVASGTVARGRTSELDKIRAGQATVVLANEDRRFDPTHATGPYYPNVLPMRRLRIRATYDTVTYDVFNGYIDRWEQTYDPPEVAHAIVSATDAFKVLAAKDLPTSAYVAEVLADAPDHWWRFNEPSGSTTAFDHGFAAERIDGTFSAGVTLGEPSLISRDSANTSARFPGPGVDATVSLPAANPAGTVGGITIEFVVRADVLTGTSRILLDAETNSGEVGVQVTAGGTVNFFAGDANVSAASISIDETVHLACVVTDAGALLVYINGVESNFTTATNTTTMVAQNLYVGSERDETTQVWDGRIDEFAIYSEALSAARIAAHHEAVATPWNGDTSGARVQRILDSIDWPTADATIDGGESTFQSTDLTGSALSYLQKAEDSEGGLLFVTKDGKIRFRSRHGGFNLVSQATFGDDVGELEYVDIAFDYSEGLIYNEIRVSRSEGVVQVAEDATSQIAYGERTYLIEGLFLAADSEARDRADFLLAKYKDPVFRTTRMVVKPAGGAEATLLYPQVLGRELGEKITVKRKPQDVGATIDQAVIVEGIQHNFGDLFWSTEFMLSPATPSPTGAAGAEFLQLNDTDGPGLGYVALAY